MIILASALAGITIGALTAKKRGGATLDMVQYAAGFGIAFTLVGLALTIVIHRLAV
ncbi:MAG: apolipoprotein acyltransferase [Marinibacterium sp.]